MASTISRRTRINSILVALGIYVLPAGVAQGQDAEQYTFAVIGTDKRTAMIQRTVTSSWRVA